MNKPMTKEELWNAVKEIDTEHNVVNVNVVPTETSETELNVVDSEVDVPAETSDTEHNIVDLNVVVDEEPRKKNLLDKYSLTGSSSVLEQEITKSVHVLGDIALTGQATIIFAAPNTGKTLITLHLVMESLNRQVIDLSKLYYINVDDTGEGLIQKLKIAEEYGFQMLSEGHKNFKTGDFKNIVLEMIEKKQCQDVIIIVDTLKKFANLMDKKKVSEFNRMVRVFVLMGGTFIALAHVNKKPDANGKPVYGGTTDTVDDFDCAYTLHKVRDEDDFTHVQFENIKRRGNVAQLANYRYCNARDITYNELLLSVGYVDSDDEFPFYEVEQRKSEMLVIEAVKAAIKNGTNTKMILTDVVAKDVGLSKRKMLKLIEEHTGTHWNFTVGERNANIFYVID